MTSSTRAEAERLAKILECSEKSTRTIIDLCEDLILSAEERGRQRGLEEMLEDTAKKLDCDCSIEHHPNGCGAMQCDRRSALRVRSLKQPRTEEE